MRKTLLRLVAPLGILALAGAIGAACSASGQGSTEGSGGGPSGGTQASGTGGTMTGSTGSEITASNGPGGGTGGACAAVSSEATSEIQPADIIIAVDTSGSMDAESAQVQQNLNNFANIITASGIDVHVVLIADSSVCIPAPLGSGACGGSDTNLPGYQHVVDGVGSNNALQKILDTYQQWKPSLRPNASKTLAVVSDDDSDLGAASFTNQLLALDPPTFQGFKFDAIVSFEDPFLACLSGGPCCAISAAPGDVYKTLVQQTSGVIGDLCLQNFNPVFTSMATAVVSGSTISCEYDIPAPPDGSMFNPSKVNVKFSSGGGNPQLIGYVPGGLGACGANGGWYYDNPNNPTRVILCPNTCAAAQGDPNGKLSVEFGCDTVIVPE